MPRLWKYVAVLVALILVGASGATAASLINGRNIKSRSIPGNRIKHGNIGGAELSRSVRAALNKRPVKGDRGAPGQPGPAGDSNASPIVVTAGSLKGFTLSPGGDDQNANNGTLTFTTGPATPPLGKGSLKLTSANGKPVIVAFPPFPGNDKPLFADLSTAVYSSYINSQGTPPSPSSDVAFKVAVTGARLASDPKNSGFTTFVFEPNNNADQGAVTTGAWHRHYPQRGKWYSSRGLLGGVCTNDANTCTMQQLAAANPNAKVEAVYLDIGQNSGANKGFSANVDDLRLGFTGSFSRYDLGG
jgi:hypothetical protein